MVGYFASWSVYGRDVHVGDLPADRLTHLVYAFAKVVDGRCALGDPYADVERYYPGDSWAPGAVRGSFNQLAKLKAAHPHLRTLLAVGGWGWSDGFSDAALTPEHRTRFAASCLELLERYGFDGLDVDWEFPVVGGLQPGRPEDKANLTLLLAELRRTFDAARPGLELTLAAPGGSWPMRHFELDRVHEHVDAVHLMTYDFAGPWSSRTGHHAPLRTGTLDPDPTASVSGAVDAYVARGVPARKLVVGIPLYGRSFTGVADGGMGGRYQPFTGLGPGTEAPGALDWRDLRRHHLAAFTPRLDRDGNVPYLFDPAQGLWISYEDPTSAAAKAVSVRDRGLGGVMFWELAADDPDASIVAAVRASLLAPGSGAAPVGAPVVAQRGRARAVGTGDGPRARARLAWA